MEEVQKKGLTRHIGISNFSLEMLERFKYNCEIMPYAIQVECNIYRQNKPLLRYCEDNNIYLMAHTTIGHPPMKGPFGVPSSRTQLSSLLPMQSTRHQHRSASSS